MSELKATTVYDAYWKANSVGDGTGIQVYLKSEADKVIGLLKDKANYNEYAYKRKSEELADTCRFYEEELRRHKYKRCLDKANYWLAVSYNCIDDEHRQKAEKHHYRWLKLAEKFKEEK